MLKHQLFPLIEKYFEEYLHGFKKKQLEIVITKGELKLQYLNLRPDTINKKLDEKNIPFWLKAGLIKKIYIGCSVMNIIGEIPLELKIDGPNARLWPCPTMCIAFPTTTTTRTSSAWAPTAPCSASKWWRTASR